jgi:hypothetical protein
MTALVHAIRVGFDPLLLPRVHDPNRPVSNPQADILNDDAIVKPAKARIRNNWREGVSLAL